MYAQRNTELLLARLRPYPDVRAARKRPLSRRNDER